jgi:hypothetical protein
MKIIHTVLQWYREQKMNDLCLRCGIGHQAVIEYHHRDPKEKRATISHMVHNGYDITTVKEEMAKCDPLCKNCHSIVHFNMANGIADQRYPGPGACA